MEEGNFKVRYNVMDISSIKAFADVKGGMACNCKDVYFVRMLGTYGLYLKDVDNLDRVFLERGGYTRFNELPKIVDLDDIAFYTGCYEEWVKSSRNICCIKINKNNKKMANALGAACNAVNLLYHEDNPNVNQSIEKNFLVKLMYWFDLVAERLLQNWDIQDSYKFVLCDRIKKQEYLFCYLLTLLGIDVMLLLPEKDIEVTGKMLEISKKVMLGTQSKCGIPEYNPSKKSNTTGSRIVDIKLPHRDRNTNIIQNETRTRRELDFEELAMLASSIVMITIHNRKGDVLGTGSGIMVGKEGYILTNNHVASGGEYYSVRIEDEEEKYPTDEVIKYNQVLDLAVIRIQKKLKTIPIYRGDKKLVRGQRVVAIGSPLGLFNSVSNGIISGFRTIDGVDMIQFTAPISHGSSGGAVLNMYGEVIGISTAGIDSGQNINLAVGYECIFNFIRGFL